MKPSSYEKWKNLASSLADDYSAAGQAKEAQSLLRKVLRVYPEEIGCRMKLANTLLALGDAASFRAEGLPLSLFPSREVAPKQQLDILNSLLQQFPDDINLKLKTAELAFSLRETASAEFLFRSLAEFYLRKDLPKKAIRIYERILEMNPDQLEIFGKIADIYVEQGIFDQAIRKLFDLAEQQMQRQNFVQAGAAYEQILAIDPVNEKACFPLAKVCILLSDIEQASKIVHKQMDNHSNKGRIDKALDLCNGFVELLLENNQAAQASREREQMADALLTRGREEEAIGLFRQVAETALAAHDLLKFIALLTHEAEFHGRQKNIRSMAETYREMILSIFPLDQEKAWVLVDDFVQELSKREQIAALDQSLRAISKALQDQRKFEDSEKVLIRLGDIYADLYRTGEAIRIYEAIVHRGSADPILFLRLADLYVQENNLPRAIGLYIKSMDLCVLANDPAGAENIFKTAFSKDAKNPNLLSKMAYVYYNIGEWDKALKFYEKAMSLDPGHRQAVVGMAMTYAKKGMLDEMVGLAKRLVTKGLIAEIVEEYRKALSLTCTPAECSMALGILYKDLGFVEEAIIEFQNASKDPKSFLQAFNLIGLCFKAQGFSHLAVRQFQKALESRDYSEEELLEIRYNLALTYEESKMLREAYELYNDILILDIGYKDVKSRLRKLGNLKTEGKVVPLDRDAEGRKS